MVNNSLSDDDDDVMGEAERALRSASPYPYTYTFEKKFPYYLAIGMTEKQYWDGDSELTRFYREADEIRKQRMNEELWLQGMYIYDALGRISPILRAFGKKGTKPEPYVEEPYPINKESVENVQEKREKAKAEKGRRYMEAYMIENNKRFEEERE